MKFLLYLFVAGVVFLQSACSYSLGKTAKVSFNKIYIAPIKNLSELPQFQAILANDIADVFNQEAGIKKGNEHNSDVELFITIQKINRLVSAKSSKDSMVASSVVNNLTLECSLKDAKAGEFIFQNKIITISTESHVLSATGQSDFQIVPILSRESARKIKNLVVNVW